ncbi:MULTISPECIES: hypothetical protein [Bacillus cereus group]|jgi:hypothetical protein|uniref:Uncharacterized protein n=1 Tax=Bacillus wiedmannii TaxID=1890302 RepID=A0A2B5XC65_9BACI|nr:MULTISPECIES: hypothetical protein [Bacillus cereus group]PEM55164.1 hypothetical protein CN611_15520 [Bacillus wiedmannii]PFU53191.1 hypothetical protein COK85_27110 [Bacillus thuringiensis]PGA93975.1 hypothetical protein COL92_26080 [Bacillus wiedmannii]PGQ72763.1 hypothetical protein COA27_12050 [Bacillus cereus]
MNITAVLVIIGAVIKTALPIVKEILGVYKDWLDISEKRERMKQGEITQQNKRPVIRRNLPKSRRTTGRKNK